MKLTPEQRREIFYAAVLIVPIAGGYLPWFVLQLIYGGWLRP